MAGDVHGGGMHDQGACMAGVYVAGGHAWQGGVHGGGWGVHVVWHTSPPQILRDTVSQCADSTHPTGMHSCVL